MRNKKIQKPPSERKEPRCRAGLTVDFEPPQLEFEGTFGFEFEAPEQKNRAGDATGVGYRTRCVTKTRRRAFYDLRNVPEAVGLIQALPKPGETVHAIMGGDFHAWDLVPAIHRLMGQPIAELIITTLGFNHGNNQNLCDMIDAGQVRMTRVVCSEYFAGADREVFNAAKLRLEERGQKVVATRNHSKILLVRPEKGADRYTVESSANLRSCNNLEQIAVSNDPKLFRFHRGWILGLFA